MNCKIGSRIRGNFQRCVVVMVLCGLASWLFLLKGACLGQEAYIWPDPNRVSIDLASPALPKVESVATCIKKYGTDSIWTWRARYFEERLKLKDDPYRSENSSFEDVRKRGAIFNAYTGAPCILYNLPPGYFKAIVWPGVGAMKFGSQIGHIPRGIMPPGAAVGHSHFDSDEILFGLINPNENFVATHWLAAIDGDFIFAPPGVPHSVTTAGTHLDIPVGGDFLGWGVASPPQWEVYGKALLGKNQSPQAKAKGWDEVWTYVKWEKDGYGLKGKPLFYEP